MAKEKSFDCAGFVLFLNRILLAAIFLWHGVPKAIDWGLAQSKFVAMNFPGFLGPIVGIAEVVLAIFLLLGFWTKKASYALGVIIIVAIVGVQLMKGVTAGLERDLLILVALAVTATHGAGSWTVSKK